MTRESTLRKNVCKILADRDAKPVENPAWPGFPDVNYIEGLIELKCVDKWPTGRDTPLKIKHFTPQQKVFLDRRWRKGGNAYLLLQVGHEYLLFEGGDLSKVGISLTELHLNDMALSIFRNLSELKEGLSIWLTR